MRRALLALLLLAAPAAAQDRLPPAPYAYSQLEDPAKEYDFVPATGPSPTAMSSKSASGHKDHLADISVKAVATVAEQRADNSHFVDDDNARVGPARVPFDGTGRPDAGAENQDRRRERDRRRARQQSPDDKADRRTECAGRERDVTGAEAGRQRESECSHR